VSRKRLHPRLIQITELTREQTLPLEAIPNRHFEVIADCVAQEWEELIALYGDAVLIDEVEVNALMCSRLNNLDHPLWNTLVAGVVRGDVISYDGTHLEKSPDLLIHLTRRPRTFRLEVECKLIDHRKRKTVSLYARHGLARFLRGEYAWASREALMVGYVCDSSTIAERLIPFFDTQLQSGSDAYGTLEMPTLVGERTDLARSVHERAFRYVHQVPDSPGPIAIWHLWLAGNTSEN
jgi:hypothetical protein